MHFFIYEDSTGNIVDEKSQQTTEEFDWSSKVH